MRDRMPLLFIGHGSPMNAIEENIYTESWKKLGKSLEKPRAILIFSAHWITEWETRISTWDNPNMIYDMYGFPEELYNVEYNALGSSLIAEEIIREIEMEYPIQRDHKRGFDHGVWSILINLFPKADIPVICMSLDYQKSPEWHYEFGKKLKNLRQKGILIIWSGNIVHNLGRLDWKGSTTYEWAKEFDDRIAKDLENTNNEDLIHFEDWWDIAKFAHPTYDHLLPLFPVLGASDESDDIGFITPDIVMGSISMRSMVWNGNEEK